MPKSPWPLQDTPRGRHGGRSIHQRVREEEASPRMTMANHGIPAQSWRNHFNSALQALSGALLGRLLCHAGSGLLSFCTSLSLHCLSAFMPPPDIHLPVPLPGGTTLRRDWFTVTNLITALKSRLPTGACIPGFGPAKHLEISIRLSYIHLLPTRRQHLVIEKQTSSSSIAPFLLNPSCGTYTMSDINLSRQSYISHILKKPLYYTNLLVTHQIIIWFYLYISKSILLL